MTSSRGNLNKYESLILKNLQEKNIKVSSELCQLLIKSFGIKDVYARKILERTAKKVLIKSSSPLTFGYGQFAYCSPTTNFTKDRIKILSKKHRPTLFRLLVALDINKGILSYYEALKITASPLTAGISKVDYLDDLIALLSKFEIVFQKVDRNLVKYIVLKREQENVENLMQVHYAKMSTDTVFLRDILDWLVKSNIIDNNNIVYRNKSNPSKGAKHNNLVWDAFAYTKTTGINPSLASQSNTPQKQTLVVLDVLINRDYEQIDLDGFLKRIQINLNSVSKGKRKVLPIVIYKNCTSLILNKIKMLGFLGYDISSIYGARIFSVLENISNLQINQKFLNQDDLEKTILDTLSTIDVSGQNEQLKAIKGTLFEMLLYQVLKQQYPIAEIIYSKTYSQDTVDNTGVTISENYEYDYIIKSSNPKEIIIIELKGYKSTNKISLGDYQTKNTVKWFFNRTLTFAKKKFQKEINEGYIFKACFITSSDFTEEAITYLETLKQGGLNPKRLNIYYNREQLFEFLEDNGYQKLLSIIDEFY